MWASSISSWDSVALGSGRTVTAMTLEFTTVWFLGEESQEAASALGDLMTLMQRVWYRLPPAKAEARVQEHQETTSSFKC